MATYMPEDMAVDQASIERQRQLAKLLTDQGLQAPQGQMVSGRYVAPSWTQYLSQGLANYRGQKMQTEADARQKALAEQLQGRRDAWVKSMPQGAPAQTMDLGEIDPSMAQYGAIETAPAKEPGADEYLTWAMKGMQVDPNAAQLGMKMADRQEGRQFQREQAQVQREQRMQELQMRMQDARLSAQERMAAQQEAARLQREFMAEQARLSREQQVSMARLTASMRPESNPNLVQVAGPDGNPVYMPARDAVGKTPFNKDKGPGNATEDERKAAGWLAQADKAYKDMEEAAAEDSKADNPGIIESLPLVPEAMKNTSRSPARQKFVQGASAFSEATLRAATGAGVNRDEAMQKVRELTPQWGDTPGVIAQKKESTKMYLESLRLRAGRAAPAGYVAPAGGSPPTQSPAANRNIVVDW